MNNPFETINVRLQNIESLLQGLQSLPQKEQIQTNEEEILTVQETASFLTLSVPTIYGFISRKELPFLKRSKRVYFLKADLIKYLKAGRKKTTAELAAEADSFLSTTKKG